MGWFARVLQRKHPESAESLSVTVNSGLFITELAESANLVDGRPTWEHAETGKDELEEMKQCCDAEVKTMEKTRLRPAPFYFKRVAVLSRKAKNYRQEVEYCEIYIRLIDRYFQHYDTLGDKEIRKGAILEPFQKRLPKAKQLLAKTQNNG